VRDDSRVWIVDYRGNTFWTTVRAPSLERDKEGKGMVVSWD
jgi:hypothetical protein